MDVSIRQHVFWLLAFFLIGPSQGDTDKLFVVDCEEGIIYMTEAVDGTFLNSVLTPLPLTGLLNPFGVDFDHRSDFVYWTDQSLHTVNRAAISGYYQEAIVKVSTTSRPNGIALDLERDNVYWTDRSSRTIEMAKLDGSEWRVVVYLEPTTVPRGIVLSQKRGKLYWTDRGRYPKIEMANLDGSNREILITNYVWNPNGIALDFAEKRLYFTDSTYDSIASVDLDFTINMIRKIIRGEASSNLYPFGVALYFEDLYFSESVDGYIYETSPSHADVYKLNIALPHPLEIHIYADTRCYSDYCLNAHSCKLVGRLPLTHECSCLPGFTGHRCQDVDACVSDPCQNGGRCVNGGEIFTCNCPTTFSGSLCETIVDACVSEPCQNGGRCVNGGEMFTCNCPTTSSGNLCETRITCSQPPEPPSSHIGDPKAVYYVDELVEITCDDADGSVQLQCQENGEWNKAALLMCDTTGTDIPLVPIVAVAAVAVVIIIVVRLVRVCKDRRKKIKRNPSSRVNKQVVVSAIYVREVRRVEVDMKLVQIRLRETQ